MTNTKITASAKAENNREIYAAQIKSGEYKWVADEIPAGPNTFYCEVNVSGDMDEDQKKRLLQIAKACPVSRLLGKPNEVVTITV